MGESLLIFITSLVSAQPLIILTPSHATLAHLELRYQTSRYIATSEEDSDWTVMTGDYYLVKKREEELVWLGAEER